MARSNSLLAMSLLALLALVALLSQSTAAAASSSSSGDSSAVVVLTEKNFDALTASGSWMLEFYAPWCGHCKTLAPIYEEAARRLHGTINLAKIDATANDKLAQRYDIKGFPTIKFFREGEVRSYNGARTVDALVSFGKEMAGPATSAITSAAEFSQLADKHPVSIVFVGGKGGAERRLFDKLAYRLQGLVKFFTVDRSATEVLSAAGVSADDTPLLLLVTSHADLSDAANRYSGPWEESSVRDFIMRNRLPLISTLDQSNFDDVTGSGKRIVYAIVNSNDKSQSDAFLESLYRLAKIDRFRSAFVFASLDGLKYNKYVSQFGVALSDADTRSLPTVVVLDTDLDYYFAPPSKQQHGGATAPVHPIGDGAAVEQFLDSVLAGRIGLTGTLPWYNPSRYVKALEKRLSKWPTWQVAALAIVLTVGLVAALFWCCFVGLDVMDEKAAAAEAVNATATSGKRKKKDDADVNDDAASNNAATSDESNTGLRARKQKEAH